MRFEKRSNHFKKSGIYDFGKDQSFWSRFEWKAEEEVERRL